ncbi:MAG: hypothetical protein IT363_00830 [Methanoregulaceae archaeon]|nr:hypothetical protein [Methanoregulaceae archaeon]
MSTGPLSTSRIFRFYVPLAASWLFMSAEAPISLRIISQLPDAKLHIAAFLMLMSMSLWIESPVIDLLSTSTALARDRKRFALISRFVWWVMGWCTVVHALVTLTPLYPLITLNVLRLPVAVADELRLPLAVMIPWSAMIGWRRYKQGLLIRNGHTRPVGVGTVVRMAFAATVGFSVASTAQFSGTMAVAIALMASVTSEAIFVHLVSRRVVAGLPEEVEGPDLSMSDLAKFHLPLTATTMLTLSAGPIVGAALARSPDSVLAMAGWQVTTTLVWMHRTIVYALPEVVITLAKDADSVRQLRRFCIGVGVFSSSLLGVLWLTRGDLAFLSGLLKTPADTAEMAHAAIILCVAFPLIGALQSFARGTLTVARMTMPRLTSVGVGMGLLFVGLGIGLAMKWPGVSIAAFAMNVALIGELAALAYFNKRALRQIHG